MILNEKHYICHYNALQKKYLEDEQKCMKEEASWKLDEKTAGKTFRCSIEWNKPSEPGDYEGFYTIMGNNPLPQPAKNITPATEYGGWGAFTAGMLDINAGEKSYGVFGQALTVNNVAVTEPIYGITSDFRSMTAFNAGAGLTAEQTKENEKAAEQCVGEKYMAVTILPKWDKTETHDALKITLQAFEWGDYKSKSRF